MIDVRYARRSLRGCLRKRNEDHLLVCTAPGVEAVVCAASDGLGGQSGGEVASRMACAIVARDCSRWRIDRQGRCWPRALGRQIAETVHRADRGIRLYARHARGLADMGATLSVLVLTASWAIVAHVGDSRIYRWRRGRLNRLTADHTFVQEMIDEGEIDMARARCHPLRNVVTRTVGTAEPLEAVDVRNVRHQPGDRFLLCTDGLSGSLSDDRIGRLLGGPGDPDQIATAMMTEAGNGTGDDISLIVVSSPDVR